MRRVNSVTIVKFSSIRRTLALGLLALALGCKSGTGPADIVGTWEATVFTLSGAISGDVLAAGGELRITCNDDSTSTGRLFIPADLAGGADFDEDLTGTWSIVDGTVTFQQAADTFVRDVQWTLSGDTLSATGSFSGVTINVVLTQA